MAVTYPSTLLIELYICIFYCLPVFLILCYIDEVLAIMKAADSLGMTNGDYAFITVDLNTDVFYNDDQWTGNEGEDSRFPDILNGIIDLSVYRPELSEDFKKKYKEVAVNQLEPSIKINLHSKVKSKDVYHILFSVWLAYRLTE